MAGNKPQTVGTKAIEAAKALHGTMPNQALSLASGLRAACNSSAFAITEMLEDNEDDPHVKDLSNTVADILAIAAALGGSDEPY